jgi:hypothetical protein
MHNGMPATQFNNLVARGSAHCQSTEIYPQILRKSQKNAPELPIGRFLKPKSLGGNRVILDVLQLR